MKMQQEILETAMKVNEQLSNQWKTHYHDFSEVGISKQAFTERHSEIGAVLINLKNFVSHAFLPRNLLPPEMTLIEELNEAKWQDNQRDPHYHQRLRMFFPPPRIPSSMDMARLGIALIAESNLLRLTDVPLTLTRPLGPSEDPITVASLIVERAPSPGNSEEFAKRVQDHLKFRPESELREDPNFGIFVAAVRNFLDGG